MKEKWNLDLDRYGEYTEVKKIGDRKREALRQFYLSEIQRKKVPPDQIEMKHYLSYSNWDTNLEQIKIAQKKYQNDYFYEKGAREYANWDTDFKDVKVPKI